MSNTTTEDTQMRRVDWRVKKELQERKNQKCQLEEEQ